MPGNGRDAAGGCVYLVGAGPGDPDLITVKGLRCLQQCDLVVYDSLANDTLLAAVPAGAQRIFAGKGLGAHALSQEQISALLVAAGLEGKQVVRLKAGDPYVFGRGGEEAEALRSAGVRFEVVPGVTSAIAAPAAVGIPVTHREYTPAFTVVTGHADPEIAASTVPWRALAEGPDTLVFLMGVGSLPLIANQLIAHGRAATTPAAVIRRGTWTDQQALLGTLATIADQVRELEVTAPAITIVGQVVSLSHALGWSGTFPLYGRRVLVTRAREQASTLSTLLRSFGASIVEYPVLRIEPADDTRALDAALGAASVYDWACFTSVNAVAAVDQRLRALGLPWAALDGLRVAAIGPATARALRAQGRSVDYLPDRFLAEAVASGMPDLEGARLLLARADIADARLVEGLEARGARVDQFVAYQTVLAEHDPAALRAALAAGEIDIVTFTSSSTARNLYQLLGSDTPSLLARTVVACIGPVTTRTARELGLVPAVIADEHTIPGLVRALREYFS